MPPEDEMLPAEEQPLPVAVSPTADSPGYIADFGPEEDPKEDPTNYPADGGDGDGDDDELSDDDKVDDDDDVEEEEEHPAPADSVLPPIHRVTARMSVRAQTPISLPSDTEILSPPLPVSSLPLPTSPTYPLGHRAAMIWLRAESPSTSHPLPSNKARVYFTTIKRRYLCTSLGSVPRLERALPAPAAKIRLEFFFKGRTMVFIATTRPCPHCFTYGERADFLSLGHWRRSMDASDIARSEVMALRTTVLAQQVEIGALRKVDRTRQAQHVETLRLVSSLQTQVTAL
ncbi:hypothetical protein Tco_1132191 [Tanacetum coccineum]|uniref:Uncharacterized protein n=1 Tax=Tanacetum coccineum TaxID=301880 RepID=A0ABQ5JB67_9ASTR